MIPVPLVQQHYTNSAYQQKNKKHLAAFLHVTAGYPPVKTFCQAIDNGFFSTWPGLSSDLIRKHLEPSIPTIMGQMQRTRQGIRSTSKPEPQPEPEIEPPLPPPRSHMDRNHQVGSGVFSLKELKGIISSDLPGHLPFISSRGMNYIIKTDQSCCPTLLCCLSWQPREGPGARAKLT